MTRPNSDPGASNEMPENLRTEYSALANYYSSVIGFRLTLLGFFIAGIGLILGGNTWPIPAQFSLLGIVLTLSLWIFEIRNRVLFYHLARRAVHIEQKHWKLNKEEITPFFSRQFPTLLDICPLPEAEEYKVPFPVFGVLFRKRRISWPEKMDYRNGFISHSFALDLLYLGIIVFFGASIISASNTPTSLPQPLTILIVTATSPPPTSTQLPTAVPQAVATVAPIPAVTIVSTQP